MKLTIISFLFPTLGFWGIPAAFAGWVLTGFVRIPSLFGALYWSLPLVGLLTPIVCMSLFLAHPIGWVAWGYSLFWFIPLGVWASGTRSSIARAYASTFVAHAVGSVLYVYTHATVPSYWWGLIPRVIIERSVFAAVLVLLYNLLHDEPYCNSNGRQSPLGKKAGFKAVLWPWRRC